MQARTRPAWRRRQHADFAGVVMAHERGPSIPPSIVPAALDQAERAALEIDRDRRLPTLAAFAKLLEAAG